MTANPILTSKKTISRVIECFSKTARTFTGCGVELFLIIPKFIS